MRIDIDSTPMEFLLVAAEFATAAHGDQKRKYTGEPYICHPMRVAQNVAVYYDFGDVEVLSAALLHDVVEDTRFGLKDIELRFNERVTGIVHELTDYLTPEDGNRAYRSAHYTDQIAAAGADAQTIKCADIQDNVSSICQYSPDFAKVWLKEAWSRLSVMERADFGLRELASESVENWMNELGVRA